MPQSRYDLNINKHGYLSVKDMPSEIDLQRYYTQKYYQQENGSYSNNYDTSELEYINNKIQQRYQLCAKIQQKQKGKFLDIGCGEGFALAYFQEKGWDVTGYDYSEFGIQRHNPDCRDYLECGNLDLLIDTAVQENKKFDVIYITNVLEHLINPDDFLSKLRSLMEKSSIACITVPNDFSILQTTLLDTGTVDREYWISAPDHLHYFNYDSLKRTITQSKFHCHDIISDFPIDWFLFNRHSNYIQYPTTGKQAHKARVAIENIIGQHSPDDINQMYSHLAKLNMGRDLTAFISAT